MKTLHIGDQLDHFRIDGLAASSGMSSIFRATDLRTGAAVAIKVPHPEIECDPVFFDRFQREQEIGKRLDHPSLIKMLIDENRSRIYMVTEWVNGRLLRQVLTDEGKLSVERAVSIVIKICEALEYVHSHGVVHRDLKPENVMIGEDDEITLIDFGIAFDTNARRLTFSKLTQTMGTPDYISPEQVRGQRGDPRSDIYSLGVMLYEMLTGKVPFSGENAFLAMNDRLVNHPVPPRELDPHISPQLQEIIYRALERDPTKRYGSAPQFARDLEHPSDVIPSARPELTSWTERRTPKERTIAFGLMLAAIPIVTFGLIIYLTHHV